MTLLTTKELADRWRLSTKTLSNWRTKQEGPSFVKFGKNVLYRIEDVEQYEQQFTHHTASSHA